MTLRPGAKVILEDNLFLKISYKQFEQAPYFSNKDSQKKLSLTE